MDQVTTAEPATGAADETQQTPDATEQLRAEIERLSAKLVDVTRQIGKMKDERRAPAPRTDAAGVSHADVEALVAYYATAAQLPDELRAEVDQIKQDAGPSVAARVAQALRKAAQTTTAATAKPARAASAAQTDSVRRYSAADLLKLPPAERAEIVRKARAGEIELE